MKVLRRLRGGFSAEADHLREWARTHAGVEAFVEPRTTVTETTMLLVAADEPRAQHLVHHGPIVAPAPQLGRSRSAFACQREDSAFA